MFIRKKNDLLTSSVLGLVCAVLVTAASCLMFSMLMYTELLPMQWAESMALTSAGVGTMAGTVVTIRMRRRQPLPAAGIVSGCYLVLISLTGAIFNSGPTAGTWVLRLAFVVFIGGMLGALMSLRQIGHRKKRYRKH